MYTYIRKYLKKYPKLMRGLQRVKRPVRRVTNVLEGGARYLWPYPRLRDVQIMRVPVSLEESLLIGSNIGLFQIRDGQLWRLLKGHFFGIAGEKGCWYVFERCRRWGRILKLNFDRDYRPKTVTVFMRGLSPGCHQMKIVKNVLYVCDTYNNRILAISLNGADRREYFPIGELDEGRASKNYGHINSIYMRPEGPVLILHNDTANSGRKSQIAFLSRSFELERICETESGAAHDVVQHEGKWIHCDSLAGTVKEDGRVVFQADMFTRGLEITKEYMIVGGSDYGSREERSDLGGRLYFLDRRDWSLVEILGFPGMVQEVKTM